MSTIVEQAPANDLYEADFYLWTLEQAALLRAKRWNDLDLENLVEEVESMGRALKSELRNRLAIVIAHLLKWRYQPGRQGKSWRNTLREQRGQIRELLNDAPSLASYPEQVLSKVYLAATLDAEQQTGIDVSVFPDLCPFSIGQILDQDFYPPDIGRYDQSGMEDTN